MIQKTFDEAGCYYVAVNYQEEMEGFPQFLYLVTFSQGSHCETNIINIPQMIMMMVMVMVTSTLALDIRTRSNSNRQGWRSSHTGRSGTFGQT